MIIPVDAASGQITSMKLFNVREVYEYANGERTDSQSRNREGRLEFRGKVTIETETLEGLDSIEAQVKFGGEKLDDFVPMVGKQVIFPRGLVANVGFDGRVHWSAPEIAVNEAKEGSVRAGKPAAPAQNGQG